MCFSWANSIIIKKTTHIFPSEFYAKSIGDIISEYLNRHISNVGIHILPIIWGDGEMSSVLGNVNARNARKPFSLAKPGESPNERSLTV